MRSVNPRYTIVFGALCVIAVLSMSMAAGCATAKKSQPVREQSSEPYQLESEGEIPPVQPSQVRKEVDRVETFEEMPVIDDAIDVENVEPPPPPTTPAETGRKTMEGYRVQVLASGSKESADVLRRAAQAITGTPAYVELIDGVYKVRVGDCPSRGEAEALLERCRDAGYGDAWIVACTVFMPPAKSSR